MQSFGLHRRQCRRRFIKNEEPGITGQCPGELDQLPVGDTQLADRGIRFRPVQSDDRHRLLRHFSERSPVDDATHCRQLSQTDVFRDAQCVDGRELLGGDGNAGRERITGRSGIVKFAIEQYFPTVTSNEAGQYVYKRCFARAVFADNRVDFALFDRQVHVIQNRSRV